MSNLIKYEGTILRSDSAKAKTRMLKDREDLLLLERLLIPAKKQQKIKVKP
ncbi:hypothetical protein MHTCC0001_02040 [Flavobacteriaceae bacterium MHTCC 0001]